MILFSWGEDMDYHISITQDGVISYPMHKHTFCEIMLYLEGNGYLRTDTENIPFESGTAIIVPQNIMHGSVSEKGFKNISIGGDFKFCLGLIALVHLITREKYAKFENPHSSESRLTDNSTP